LRASRTDEDETNYVIKEREGGKKGTPDRTLILITFKPCLIKMFFTYGKGWLPTYSVVTSNIQILTDFLF